MTFATIDLFAKQFTLVWFFIIFLIIIIWAFWPGNRKRFEKAGRMALDDDDQPEPSTGKASPGHTDHTDHTNHRPDHGLDHTSEISAGKPPP
ncbi:MAG: cbb3-type cytochrome c oxidase subunit 3 [Magnetococcus sp. DMHC-1]|nr:cbb3-type cytochrome c oxidase subunit 3 [Magnetococcales bacterium]